MKHMIHGVTTHHLHIPSSMPASLPFLNTITDYVPEPESIAAEQLTQTYAYTDLTEILGGKIYQTDLFTTYQFMLVEKDTDTILSITTFKIESIV